MPTLSQHRSFDRTYLGAIFIEEKYLDICKLWTTCLKVSYIAPRVSELWFNVPSSMRPYGDEISVSNSHRKDQRSGGSILRSLDW